MIGTLKNKFELLRFVQTLNRSKIQSMKVETKDDKKTLIKEFDHLIKKGPMTIVFIGTDE